MIYGIYKDNMQGRFKKIAERPNMWDAESFVANEKLKMLNTPVWRAYMNANPNKSIIFSKKEK